MEAMENILTRRSVKKYKLDPVPQDIVEKIAQAGTYAATGMNMQSPIIIEVTDKSLRDRLSRLNAQVLGTDSDPFYSAPAVLVVLADRSIRTYKSDGALVMGNLMLAANALGVGSCWINRAKEVFDTDEGKEILRNIGISGDYEGIANCVLGYPDGDIPPVKPRKDNYIYRVL